MKRFHYKIALLCSFFGLVTLLISVVFIYRYAYSYYLQNAQVMLNNASKEISMQLDGKLNQMDIQAVSFVSNQEMIRNLKNLTYLNGQYTEDNEQINRSIMFMRQNVYNDYVSNNYFRFCVFNVMGNLFTENDDRVLNTKVLTDRIKNLTWLKKAREQEGRMIVLPVHKDTWSMNMTQDVFSVARVIRDPGKEIGFVEVQEKADYLQKVCFNNQYETLVLDNDKNVIFASKVWSQKIFDSYKNLVSSNKNQISYQEEMIGIKRSDMTGWTVLTIQSKNVFLYSFTVARNILIVVILVFIIIMTLLSYYMAMRLTKPLRQLKIAMENINMQSIINKKDLAVNGTGDEVASLNRSFSIMKERLNYALEKEVAGRSMQLRSHFNALQAQINPHFIHNMLNVVMEMALENRPDDVIDICQKISDMMRYSTADESQPITIEDEMGHVYNYLSLMKERYGDKLTYDIKMDEEVRSVKIPKLIIQPIVENAFYHGFSKNKREIHIGVYAGFCQNGGWRISVEDDGVGFDEQVLKNLREKIKSYKDDFDRVNEDLKGGIGNMGIINTFARLELFYNQQIYFEVGNTEKGGAGIVFTNARPERDYGV